VRARVVGFSCSPSQTLVNYCRLTASADITGWSRKYRTEFTALYYLAALSHGVMQETEMFRNELETRKWIKCWTLHLKTFLRSVAGDYPTEKRQYWRQFQASRGINTFCNIQNHSTEILVSVSTTTVLAADEVINHLSFQSVLSDRRPSKTSMPGDGAARNQCFVRDETRFHCLRGNSAVISVNGPSVFCSS